MKNKFKLIHNESAVKRYSQFHLIKGESVLEHSAVVGFLVMLIISDLNKINPYYNFDYKKLYESVILHDLDEIVTGDIPRTTKYSDEETRKKFQELEERGMKLIVKDHFLNDTIYKTWKEAKSGIEGEILKIADTISVIYKLWEEVSIYNNLGMIDVTKQVYNSMPVMLDLYSGKIQNSIEEEKFIYEYLHEYLLDARYILNEFHK